MNFRNFWETLNEGTNLLGFFLILAGGGLALKGHTTEAGALMTGGFTLLNNSKKRDPDQTPPEAKP